MGRARSVTYVGFVVSLCVLLANLAGRKRQPLHTASLAASGGQLHGHEMPTATAALKDEYLIAHDLILALMSFIGMALNKF